MPKEVPIQRCMLFELHKDTKATVATKNIFSIYAIA